VGPYAARAPPPNSAGSTPPLTRGRPQSARAPAKRRKDTESGG
jgi:hypothetical protein